MIRMFVEMIRFPVRVFVYSMEMFTRTVQGVQGIADRGLDEMVGDVPAADHRTDFSQAGSPAPAVQLPDDSHFENGAGAEDATVATFQKEKRTMDQDLNDDLLKLVRYKILFVKRDYEHAFPEQEDLVHDNINASGFTAWKVAEFIQRLGEKDTPLPKKWKDKKYPPEGRFREGDILLGLPDEDKKYLRVYYEVLDRYTREKLEYEERKIDALEGIRDDLRDMLNQKKDSPV